MIDKLINAFKLNKEDIVYIFAYGSRVYGNYSNKSDYDHIIICKDNTVENDYALHEGDFSANLYQESLFDKHVLEHKPYALESIFLDDKFVYANKFNLNNFKLNLAKLRSSFSEKASHSWVKAKKKLEVEKDRDVYIAKKSLFHSLRIIDFGTQIAKNNKIIDYSSSNFIWYEIKDNKEDHWDYYNNKYKELFNSRMTEFRKVAPK